MIFSSHPGIIHCIIFSAILPTWSSTFLPLQPHNACTQIQKALSHESTVYYPGDAKYEKGISHYSQASTQRSKCVVEPGSEADIGKILNIVGRTGTPFAIKGGGHATNPGFSSTTGVHISMTRFSEINYHAITKTADVGMGLIWDDVYAALERYNRTVVGGRVTGVGVAGLSLGGGYSWKTNQYGLTIDTIEAFRLVKPDGSITTVTHASQPELFFALKGTQNNFGIVTSITFQTVPQTAVWGGFALFDMPVLDQVAATTTSFHKNVLDPKASILSTFLIMNGRPVSTILAFYDGPTPPPGIFDPFTSLPAIMSDLKTRSYLSLVQSSAAAFTDDQRVFYGTLPHPDVTPEFLKATISELVATGQPLTNRNDTFLGLVIEPFLPTILQHTNLPSAYPATRTRAYLPLNICAGWPDAGSDEAFYDAFKGIQDRLRAVAIADGQNISEDTPTYPNYALWNTPLEKIFGMNLPRLRKLKKKVDPHNVMGLAGGFKL